MHPGMQKFGFILILISFLPACSLLVGIKDPVPLTDQEIIRHAEQMELPDPLFKLDTAYMDFLKAWYISDTLAIKNHYQPLQVLYFDKAGILQSWHINCLVPGFPELKWNHNGSFDVFPPHTAALPDTLYSLQRVSKLFLPVQSEKTESTPDYTVLVFWNAFMRKQSKILSGTVRTNLQLAPDSLRVNVIYINNDNFFSSWHRN
jgi:hypothetical protein